MLDKKRDAFYTYMFRRSFLPLFLILLVISGSFLFLYHTVVIRETEKNKENSMNRLNLCVSSLERELNETEQWSRQLLNEVEFQRFVYMYEDLDIYTRFSLQKKLHNALYDLYYRDNNISDVCLYIPFINKVITDKHPQTSVKEGMKELLALKDGTYRLKNKNLITCIHWDEDGVRAVLIVNWDCEQMIKHLKTQYLSEEENLDMIWNPSEFPEKQLIYSDSQYYPFRMVCEPIIADDIESFISQVGFFSILFMIICLMIAVISMLTWYREIYYPLHRLLIEAFDHMEKNDFNYRIEIKKENAIFHSIYNKYNHMVDAMQRYIETNLQQQILVSRSNLKQLQSQISPHFMYNSYYILYRMLRRKDLENSMRLAEYLGSFYQYITRNADDEKRLIEELNHAKNYAQIQKYRFGDNIRISIAEPAEEIADIYVPRLILQPILENVFKYGYENGNGDPIQLQISFEVKDTNDFSILIENSGELLEETLEMLCQRLESTDTEIETTAIINIHRRIQIYFGKESGLSVERSALGGLKVIMHIVRKEDEE
ncbi:MAG: sensor histidine kinase [Marvinbryantia sp.]|jgi:two-component system sensor histidine kinase YesM